jgi:hypothetical protein
MVPAGHLVQLAAPAVLLYAPLVQAKQLDAPLLLWKVPGEHAEQLPTPAREYVPAPQVTQLVEPEVAEDRVPAAHVKHPAAPLAL